MAPVQRHGQNAGNDAAEHLCAAAGSALVSASMPQQHSAKGFAFCDKSSQGSQQGRTVERMGRQLRRVRTGAELTWAEKGSQVGNSALTSQDVYPDLVPVAVEHDGGPQHASGTDTAAGERRGYERKRSTSAQTRDPLHRFGVHSCGVKLNFTLMALWCSWHVDF